MISIYVCMHCIVAFFDQLLTFYVYLKIIVTLSGPFQVHIRIVHCCRIYVYMYLIMYYVLYVALIGYHVVKHVQCHCSLYSYIHSKRTLGYPVHIYTGYN